MKPAIPVAGKKLTALMAMSMLCSLWHMPLSARADMRAELKSRYENVQRAVDVATGLVSSHPGAGDERITVGDIIRLVGYSRTTDPRVLAWLVSHAGFDTRPNEITLELQQVQGRFPAGSALREIGFPAVPLLLHALRVPPAKDCSFYGTGNHYLASTIVDIVGDNGTAILEAAITGETDPTARRALEAARVDFPTTWMYAYQELVPRTLDLPENPVHYDDMEQLRAAMTSTDDAVRHGALSGVLAERKMLIRDLTDAVRQPGPLSADTVHLFGLLRPRQQECLDAVLDELEQAADDGDEAYVRTLADALGRIGAPAVRASVKRIAASVSSRARETAHARVLSVCLGRYSDEWIKDEIKYEPMPKEAKERLRAAQVRNQKLFVGDGVWGLP